MNSWMDKIMEFIYAWTPAVIKAVVILIIGLIVIGWITRLLKRMLEKREIDKAVSSFLVSICNILLKVLLIFTIVGMFGVPVASFVAILGAMAFAVGMALQGTLGHFASGVILLITKPYRIGDYVNIGGGDTGTVDAIEIFNTKLRTPGNEIIYVPNGIVTSNSIHNITHEDIRRITTTVGIGYTDDIDKAKELLKNIAENCPQHLKDENYPVDVTVSQLAGSSVNLTAHVWAKTDDYGTVKFYMLEQVKKQFDEAGINMPFPQMDVHLNQVNS